MSDLMTNTTSSNTNIPSSRVKFGLIRQKTREILATLSKDELRIPSVVETELLEGCNTMIEAENVSRDGHKWKYLDTLLPMQVADALMAAYPIVKIAGADDGNDSSGDLIAIYQEDGENRGVYSSDEAVLRSMIREYSYNMNSKDVSEVIAILQDCLPRKFRCKEKNLIAVNNGIFDYDTKQLLSFDEKYVFLSKCKVNYNPNAKNVVIHNDEDGTDWDIESWMDELTDDPEITHVLWQILGAIIRPNVPWGKAAWFYSETGNNGKGTLCELMRQLCGRGSYASVSLSDFSKEFMLEPLVRATSIIVDENDVGTYIDKAANLKAVITGDTIFINRKFKVPIAYQFKGFMVQCLNEMPRIKDKSDSFFRRQLFIPFTKCFTGKERKYIKHDYLHRAEVLEYVLYRVLHMDYYELDTPAACVDALEEYKSYVDPIREFLEEVMPKVKWDLLPFSFLYDLYVSWYKQTHNGDKNIKSLRGFTMDVRKLIESNYSAWACTDSGAGMRPSSRMDDAEPLIATYGLTNWMNPLYMTDRGLDRKCHPLTLAVRYRGIYRLVTQQGSDEDLEFANSTDSEEIPDEM